MGNSTKTILFVMPRLPFPASSGRKTSLYHYCRILSEELGYKLIVAAFLENGDNPELKPEFIDKLFVLPAIAIKDKIINIFIDSILLKRKPMQVSLYWSREVKKFINKIVEEECPDIIIGDMVRSTEYIKDVDIFRIADLDDRISLRYQRQMDTNMDNINPYGAFLQNVPKFIQIIAMCKPIKLYVVKNEIALLKKYELYIARKCECTIFVAKQEADQLNKELGENKAVAVPIGVDTKYFSYRNTGLDDDYIGFLGSMNVAHNENAVFYFVENILPKIIKKNKNAKFLVIGGGASEKLLRLKSLNVEFTGKVDDVRPYLERCKVFVCPLLFGSGIKTKNLEAMSMGLPVVTTKIGAENIDAQNGYEWLILDEIDEIADEILKLLDNDEYRLALGRNASNYIQNNFTWDKVASIFKEILVI